MPHARERAARDHTHKNHPRHNAARFQRQIPNKPVISPQNSPKIFYRNSVVTLNPVFEPFYEILELKAEQFVLVDDEEWRKNLRVELDSKDNLHKVVKMEHSIIYYQDIMTHIMMLVDEELLNQNEKLLGRVKRILKYFLRGIDQIKLKEIKKNELLHPLYFTDLLDVMNKSWTLISRLLQKTKNMKDLQRMRDFPQYKIMENLANYFEELTGNGVKLVNTVITLLQVTPTSACKQKLDCFLNIRHFINFYPVLVIEHFDEILADSFFTEPRNNLSINDVNNI
jgi:hypothetical protein